MSAYDEAIEYVKKNSPPPQPKNTMARLKQQFGEGKESNATNYKYNAQQAAVIIGYINEMRSFQEKLDQHLIRISLTQIAGNKLIGYCPSEISVPLPASYPRPPNVNLRNAEEVKQFIQDAEKMKMYTQKVKAWEKTSDAAKYVEDRTKAETKASERILHINYFQNLSNLERYNSVERFLQGAPIQFGNAWERAKKDNLQGEFCDIMIRDMGCADFCLEKIQEWNESYERKAAQAVQAKEPAPEKQATNQSPQAKTGIEWIDNFIHGKISAKELPARNFESAELFTSLVAAYLEGMVDGGKIETFFETIRDAPFTINGQKLVDEQGKYHGGLAKCLEGVMLWDWKDEENKASKIYEPEITPTPTPRGGSPAQLHAKAPVKPAQEQAKPQAVVKAPVKPTQVEAKPQAAVKAPVKPAQEQAKPQAVAKAPVKPAQVEAKPQVAATPKGVSQLKSMFESKPESKPTVKTTAPVIKPENKPVAKAAPPVIKPESQPIVKPSPVKVEGDKPPTQDKRVEPVGGALATFREKSEEVKSQTTVVVQTNPPAKPAVTPPVAVTKPSVTPVMPSEADQRPKPITAAAQGQKSAAPPVAQKPVTSESKSAAYDYNGKWQELKENISQITFGVEDKFLARNSHEKLNKIIKEFDNLGKNANDPAFQKQRLDRLKKEAEGIVASNIKNPALNKLINEIKKLEVPDPNPPKRTFGGAKAK